MQAALEARMAAELREIGQQGDIVATVSSEHWAWSAGMQAFLETEAPVLTDKDDIGLFCG